MREYGRAYVWMLCSAASFAVMATGISGLRATFSWQTIAVARTAIALVLAIVLTHAVGARLVYFRPASLWLRSFSGSFALLANFYCLTHFPASESLALLNLFPLWVTLLSWPILGQRPRAFVWPATFAALTGVFIMLRPQFEHGLQPVIIAVAGSWGSAFAMIGLHKLKDVDSRAVVAHFSAVSLACSLGAWLMVPSPLGEVDRSAFAWLLLLAVGVAATLGQLFLTKAFAAGPPAQIAVVNLTQVGFTMILEWLLLGRTFEWTSLVGISIVVLATAWVMTRRA